MVVSLKLKKRSLIIIPMSTDSYVIKEQRKVYLSESKKFSLEVI